MPIVCLNKEMDKEKGGIDDDWWLIMIGDDVVDYHRYLSLISVIECHSICY